jgi:hypothetical protein
VLVVPPKAALVALLALLFPPDVIPPTLAGEPSSVWLDELHAQSALKEAANDKALSDAVDLIGFS